MLGELSRLLMQLKQSTNGVKDKDAWFVIALNGTCMYMNPAAESLCEIRLEEITSASGAQLLTAAQGQDLSLLTEGIFAKLLLRVRNSDEVQLYLREFAQGSVYRQELRCILAHEPLQTQGYLLGGSE